MRTPLVFAGVACGPGETALGGGSFFTDDSNILREGMLMASAPIQGPMGWNAAGSTLWSSGGIEGDRIQTQVICGLM